VLCGGEEVCVGGGGVLCGGEEVCCVGGGGVLCGGEEVCVGGGCFGPNVTSGAQHTERPRNLSLPLPCKHTQHLDLHA